MSRTRWATLVAATAMLLGGCGADEPTDAPAVEARAEPAPKADRPKPKPAAKPKACIYRGPPGETAGEALERCDPTYEPSARPDDAQALALVAALAAVEPALAEDPDSVVSASISTCTSIMGSTQSEADLLDATVDRFAYDAGYDYSGRNQMPEFSARSIVAAIEAEPWCR